MTKEKIIKALKSEMEKAEDDLRICKKYKRNGEYELGKVEGLRIALLLVEAMHDDEYWNEAIAGAIAMGDR